MNSTPIDPAQDQQSATQGIQGREQTNSADAGTDESIAKRLARNPESKEARLDRALDESMDASDPPASTQPVHSHHDRRELPESSGFDPAKEKRLAQGKPEEPGLVERVLSKIGLG